MVYYMEGMLPFQIISNSQLVEGFVGCISFPIMLRILQKEGLTGILLSMIAWFIAWVIRKLCVNAYQYYYSSSEYTNIKKSVYTHE